MIEYDFIGRNQKKILSATVKMQNRLRIMSLATLIWSTGLQNQNRMFLSLLIGTSQVAA